MIISSKLYSIFLFVSADIMLIQLSFDRQLRCLEPIHWKQPPKHIPVAKHVNQFIKVCLLLKLDQLFISDLLMQIFLEFIVVLSLL